MRRALGIGWLACLVMVGAVGEAPVALARKAVRKLPPPVKIPPGTPTVTLAVRVSPPVKATVHWGRTNLGETPVIVPFPRDSGPVDVVVRAQGYVALHTRLNTFANDSVTVKLVPEAEKRTVFGFKKELPPPPQPAGVAGVPPALAPAGLVPGAGPGAVPGVVPAAPAVPATPGAVPAVPVPLRPPAQPGAPGGAPPAAPAPGG